MLDTTETNTGMHAGLTTQRLALSVEEVSETTGLSKAKVRNMIAAGELKAKKVGRRVLVRTEDLLEYLAAD